MKTLCWIAVIGLTVVTSILWRNNAGLRKEIDAGTKTLVALSIPSDYSNQTHDRSRSTVQQSPESDETDLEISANRALDIGDGATLLRILQDWAQSNPTAALMWFHRNHSKQKLAGNGRVDAIRNSYAAILAGMIANDPAQATKLIASAPESELAVTFHFIVRKILPSDLDKLTDQLTVNPDPEFRYAGFRYIAAALGQTIRFEEARLLLEKAGDFSEDDRNQITLGFARNVDIGSFNERRELANWIAATSPSENTTRNVSWFVDRWANVNFDEVATWLKDQSDSPWHDHAVAAFAKKANSVDPERAQDWATTISDTMLRDEVVTSLAGEEQQDW